MLLKRNRDRMTKGTELQKYDERRENCQGWRDKTGEIYFLLELNPLWTIRNSTCEGFITILCDCKCANMFPERDGSKMNRKRGDLLKYGKRREERKKRRQRE